MQTARGPNSVWRKKSGAARLHGNRFDGNHGEEHMTENFLFIAMCKHIFCGRTIQVFGQTKVITCVTAEPDDYNIATCEVIEPESHKDS